jgi:type I restriction enzyme, R subunit
MPETPEQRTRREIDGNLTAAGWIVQNRDELDLTAGRGIAVNDFSMKSGFGFADYLLYLDRKALGLPTAIPSGPSMIAITRTPKMGRSVLASRDIRHRSCRGTLGPP